MNYFKNINLHGLHLVSFRKTELHTPCLQLGLSMIKQMQKWDSGFWEDVLARLSSELPTAALGWKLVTRLQSGCGDG